MKRFFDALVAGFIIMLVAYPAFATDFFTAPTVDAAAVGTMVTSILAALASIWACRKAVKMINRS